MKTKLVIEIESKDKLMAKLEEGALADEKENVLQNIAKEFHNEAVIAFRKYIEDWNGELPEDIQDNYIEGYDDMDDYGLKATIKK